MRTAARLGSSGMAGELKAINPGGRVAAPPVLQDALPEEPSFEGELGMWNTTKMCCIKAVTAT